MTDQTVHLIHLGEPSGYAYGQAREAVNSFNAMGNPCALWEEDDLRLRYGRALVNRVVMDFPSLAGASNVFRLWVINDFGGIYADTDIICHKPIHKLFEHEAFGAIQDDEGRICNAFFGARKNHPWIRWQIDHVYEYKGLGAYWGVDLMSRAPREGVTLIDPAICYPYSWTTPKDERKLKPETLVEHKWAGSWIK